MGGQRLSEQKSWAIVDAYAAEHSHVFAGAYVGGEGVAEFGRFALGFLTRRLGLLEPPIVTLWTRDAASHAEALSNRTGRTIGGRSARWSEAYLDSVRERITDDMDQLRAEGIAVCLVGDNVMENCVNVGVIGLTAEARETIISCYGHALNIFESEIIAA